MKNQRESIRKMVTYLNNDEKDGGFWLPNIQRPFVWKEDQIERLFDSIMREYGSKDIHLLFNLWYKDFDYTPAYEDNLPQVDHIFPQSLLRTVKEPNPETGRRNILKYKSQERDQIANCMLLTADENGPSNKRDIPPDKWFADKPNDYLDLHLIPKDRDLWKLEKFEQFIEARKELILNKFNYMIQSDI